MLVHDRPFRHRNDGFRGWRSVAQGAVRSLRIVMASPFFDDDLCFLQRVEDFTV
jgi:hypothetical protein